MKLRIEVTDAHIAKGMKNFTHGGKCPYGLAINDALKKAKLKLKGSIYWGGEVEIENTRTREAQSYYPRELRSMPPHYDGEFTSDHIRWIATKRKFTIDLDLDD